MKPGGIVALVSLSLGLALVLGCGGSKEDGAADKEGEQQASDSDESSAKAAEGGGDEKSADTADGKAAGDTPKPVSGVIADAETVAVAPAVPGLDVAPLELLSISPNTYARSVAQNTKGYRLHAKGKLKEAKPFYIEALKIDPGNLLARYNLASILVQTGDKQQGIALLAQFKAIPDCNFCLGIIVHSRTDSEWNDVHDDPAYKAVADDVKVWKPSLKWAAKELITALESGRIGKNLKALLHPRRTIAKTTVKKHKTELLGEKALVTWLDGVRESNKEDPEDEPGTIIDGFMECEKLCCTFSGDAQTGLQSSLETMCVKKAPGGALYLASLDFYNQFAEQDNSDEYEAMEEYYRAMEAEELAAEEAARKAAEEANKDLE